MSPWVYYLILAGLIPLCIALIRGKIGGVSQIFIVCGVAFGLWLSTLSHHLAADAEQAINQWEEVYGGNQIGGFTLVEKAAESVGIGHIVYHINSYWSGEDILFLAPTLRIVCAYAIGLYSLIGSWLFIHFLERRLKFADGSASGHGRSNT